MITARELTGPDALRVLGPALDELHAATATPVTSRRTWLETWVRAYPQYRPWVLAIEDGSGRLRATAPLAWRSRGGVTDVVAIGHGDSDDVRLPARDDVAAILLAAALAARLRAVRTPWRLHVSQLPTDDPVAAETKAILPFAKVVPADPSPVTRFTADRSPRAYVSRNHHQQVRRMMNRLRRDGLAPHVESTRDPGRVRALLPAIEQVCRRRDAALHRRSPFERPEKRRFFHDVVSRFAERHEVELLTIHLDGRLAAYVLCFLDHEAYRMWSCRFDPEWDRYGIGRIGNHLALTRALTDPRAGEFDWMRGDEPYKFSMANAVNGAVDLLAWSGPVSQAITDAPRQFKSSLKPVLARHQRLRDARASLEKVGYLIGKTR